MKKLHTRSGTRTRKTFRSGDFKSIPAIWLGNDLSRFPSENVSVGVARSLPFLEVAATQTATRGRPND